MGQIPYYNNPGGNLTVKVELRHSADVFLLDQANFNARQRGNGFEYFGGHFDHTPATVTVSGAGRWYLIVENGSSESFRYQWIK